MNNITKAQSSRTEKTLDKLMNYSLYGILSRREFLQRSLRDGCTLETKQVEDEALRNKLRKEYEFSNRGFAPWGNPSHPRTIAAQKIKDQLAGEVTKPEYRLWRPDRDYFTILTKIEYDYASSLQTENFS